MMKFMPFIEPKGSYEPLPEHEGVNHRRNRFSSSFSSHLLSFLAGCLLIILGGFTYRIAVSTQAQFWSPIPFMPLKTVVFASHPEFSTASTTAWDSLTKDFSGYIQVADPEAYNLQPGLLNEEGKEVYGVAMYHSLHCLTTIHHEYWRLLSSDPTPTEPAVSAHIGHCFDYVRQSIQCSADMTISWANLTEPERPHIDGWDIPHRQCRDWKSVLPDLIAMDAVPGVNEHHSHAGIQ